MHACRLLQTRHYINVDQKLDATTFLVANADASIHIRMSHVKHNMLLSADRLLFSASFVCSVALYYL